MPRRNRSRKTDAVQKRGAKTQIVAPPAYDAWLRPAICIGLVALVWSVFAQTLGFDFVNFDDNSYVYAEPHVSRGLSWDGLAWAFTSKHVGNWHPLTSVSLMLDVQLFGVNAGAHHAVNVILHTGAAVLLFLAMHRLTGATWCSAFVAALFAIHPLKVESVVWISERKDVLSGLFFMLTLAAYARYVRSGRRIVPYMFVVLSCALGLMAKPMLVTLPLVLLLLDYWPLGRFNSTANADAGRPLSHHLATAYRLLVEKVPLFALAAASACATLFAQGEALRSGETIPLSWRLPNALLSMFAYIRQSFWPAALSPFYPHPRDEFNMALVVLALLLFIAITGTTLMLRERAPFVFVGWLWFVVMLLPVIGIIQVGWQARADRYMYLPQIGLTIVLAWTAANVIRTWQRLRTSIAAAAAVVVVALAWATSVQAKHWRDAESLWRRALLVTSNNDVAHQGLGTALSAKGDFGEAAAHFRKAIIIRPGNPDLKVNLANALRGRGELSEAIRLYREVLQAMPAHFDARRNLAAGLLQSGSFDEAAAEYARLLEEQPSNAEFHFALGKLHAQKKEFDQAIARFREAVKLQPAYPDALNDLAVALFQTGRMEEAITAWSRTVELQPDRADAHNNLGVALLRSGHTVRAVEHLRRAATLQPGNVSTHLTLAWVLATSADAAVRDGAQAVRLAESASRASRDANPIALRILAAAFAESGRFEDAEAAADRALQIATATGEHTLVSALQSEMQLLRAGVPIRDTTLHDVSNQ